MKKNLLSFILIVVNLSLAFAQAPNSFTYQGIATRSNDTPMANKGISFRISILAVSETGVTDYSEKHTVVTTNNGVFTLNIGLGSAPTSTFANINWNANAKYLRVEMDTTNTNSYQVIGTPTLLQSVPFALQAANSAKIQGVNISTTAPTTNQVLTYDGTNWIPKTPTPYTGGTGISVSGTSITNTAPVPAGTAVGQVLTYNGTAWIPTTPVVNKAPKITVLKSGSGTHTLTGSPLYIRVKMVGGGGGGQGGSTNASPPTGTAGGTTTFGSNLLICNGGNPGMYTGTNAGGTAISNVGYGTVLQGGNGSSPGVGNPSVTEAYLSGGAGAPSPFGGAGGGMWNINKGNDATSNSGSGGSGAAGPENKNLIPGCGGGAGGYIDVIITNLLTSYSYSIGVGGTGGAAGTGGYNGGDGGSGVIIIEEYYQ